jgi:mannose/cellobiose epimerase-like protein (N-acyl-D-glucosamine 2-epimerase family)
VFRSIDGRAHDTELLGYDQTQDPGFFSPGTQKETNTHIHLLEAFTALYRLTQDPLVKARLTELVEVTARKIGIETSWLLLDAVDALGRSGDHAAGRHRFSPGGLYELSHDGAQLTRLEKTMAFIEQHQRDREYGEWYWGVLPGSQARRRAVIHASEGGRPTVRPPVASVVSEWLSLAVAK